MKMKKEIEGKVIVIETDEFSKNVWIRNGFESVDTAMETIEPQKNKGGRKKK